MSDTDPVGGEPGWPWLFRWPAVVNTLPAAFAPERLWQPINPGWSFGNVTVNSSNSSAPDVEQALVAKFSYGRQLGRLTEALDTLLKATPAVKDDPAVKDFVAMSAEIRAAKAEAKKTRLSRLAAELAALKKSDRAAWEKLVKP